MKKALREKMDEHTPVRKTKKGKYIRKVKNRILRYRKAFHILTHKYEGIEKRNVFIFGCQRSGTTLLGNIFDVDLRTAVLQEISRITKDENDVLRLKPLEKVKLELEKIKQPLVIAKPLVESHNADRILNEIPNSKGIWLFRSYSDVVASNTKRFSSQIEGLRMSITGDPASWRSERISDATLKIKKRFYSPDMKQEDAAALGWYSINVLFFELGLDKNPNMILLKYEDFVTEGEKQMKIIYDFIGMDYPKNELTGQVDSLSIALGKKIEIHPQIEEICNELYKRIEEQYEKQSRK